MIHNVFACTFGTDGHIPDRKGGSQRLHFLFLHNKVHLTPHHHLRHFFFTGFRHINGSDIPSFSEYSTAVCNCLDLCQFVGDKQNGFSFRYQLFHNLHEFINFLRRQHGGGFIKDKYLIVAVEHFQNFHSLLHAHCNIADQGVRVNFKLVPLA